MKRYHLLLVTMMCMLVGGPLLAQSAQPKLIDGHVHYNGDPAFLQKLLAKLDSVDGMAFLLVPAAEMDTAVPFIHAHPNRLVGFGSIRLDSPEALQQIDRFHAAGFRGLGELTSSLHNYDDSAYWPIYERAARYHMILLFHTGVVARGNPSKPQDVSFERMRATRLDRIARSFPTLTLIGGHMGNPDYAEAAEIGRWDPNLYFDLSGSSLIKKQNDYTFFKSIFWWSGVVSPHTPKGGHSAFEKLVFGSDVFGGDLEEFDRELKRYHALLDACDVPPQAQEEIFSGTLWRILNQQKESAASN